MHTRTRMRTCKSTMSEHDGLPGIHGMPWLEELLDELLDVVDDGLVLLAIQTHSTHSLFRGH